MRYMRGSMFVYVLLTGAALAGYPDLGQSSADKMPPLHLINLTINDTVDVKSQIEQRDRKGVGLAIGLTRWRGYGARPVNYLMLFPLVTPEIVMAVSLLLVSLLYQRFVFRKRGTSVDIT